MPATLPWPKIAQTPPKSGSFSPSISVICRARKRVSACAIVRRMVLRHGRFLPAVLYAAFWPRAASQASVSFSKRPAMSAIAVSSDHAAGEPLFGRLVEDRAADGKTLDDRRVGASPRRPPPARAAALRGRAARRRGTTDRASAIDRLDLLPGAGRCLRLELPPVGLDAERIEFFQRARNGRRRRARRACRR